MMNPFAVQTPEGIPAEQAVSLFVSEVPGFQHMRDPGHAFLHGARGSGKSMIFRYLEPDCQRIALRKPLDAHSFFGAYVPIKETEFRLTELDRLNDKHADTVLNEHFLTVGVLGKILRSLKERVGYDQLECSDNRPLHRFYNETFALLLKRSFWNGELPRVNPSDGTGIVLQYITGIADDIYADALQYVRRLAWTDQVIPYNGPLMGYLDFLVPFVHGLMELPFMPHGPMYFLIDDADNLSYMQTRVLNNWVSTRTVKNVCLKVSTQHNYKIFRTTNEQRIEAPHDFAEISISDVYTSDRRDNYRERVRKIVSKRLSNVGLRPDPELFFPEDDAQENRIREIAESYRKQDAANVRGHRARDDAYRYARPDYIRDLRGRRKSGSTYSYAGFNQLVHVSSGVVRFFLEASSRMYDRAQRRSSSERLDRIPAHIQNEVIREQANELLFEEFEKIRRDEGEPDVDLDRPMKLFNLVQALGGMFQCILLSGRSERRVFSIAFSDAPDKEVGEILEMGIRYGYLHRSSIGKKEGIGKTHLFILTRQLAPVFTLDPTGFAGYQFVTNEAIRLALNDPDKYVARFKKRVNSSPADSDQALLFEWDAE